MDAKVDDFFKQTGSIIQSNDIEHVYHLFSRNKWTISLQNYFLRSNMSRENWIWLDNVWLINKDQFFNTIPNVSSNILYDSTRSSFIQVMGSNQLK
ncbi:hypothetical protein AAZX31_06G285500 [Glycine max]